MFEEGIKFIHICDNHLCEFDIKIRIKLLGGLQVEKRGTENELHESTHDHDNAGKNELGRNLVEININDAKYTVHRGRTSVAELKRLADVNPAWVLYLFGQPEPLDDAGFVIIKGGEEFLASARSGQSS